MWETLQILKKVYIFFLAIVQGKLFSFWDGRMESEDGGSSNKVVAIQEVILLLSFRIFVESLINSYTGR